MNLRIRQAQGGTVIAVLPGYILPNQLFDRSFQVVRTMVALDRSLTRLRKLRATLPGFDREVWTELANAGWFGVLVPEEDGGLGLGLREMCAIAGQVGQFLLPEPYIAGAVQAAGALVACAPGARRTALLDQLVAGAYVRIFGL